MHKKLQEELKKFNKFKDYFKFNHPGYSELDNYGFSLSSDKNSVNILFTALTHGDEVIGIQIINLILQDIMIHNNLNFKPAFLLNNIEAFNKNVRSIESDLNRSFCISDLNTKEKIRAREIENIISKLKIDLLLDLHQTIEPAVGPFAIIPEDLDLIGLARAIAKDYSIVTFSNQGFSDKGKTLIEYAKTLSIPALVFELGQKGFNDLQANEFKNIVMNLDINQLTQHKSDQSIDYFLINDHIPNIDQLRLVEGLSNLQPISKGQILAQNNEIFCFKCPSDSIRYFRTIMQKKKIVSWDYWP